MKLQKDEFIGKEVLAEQKVEGVNRKRIGLMMIDQGIPRSGFEIRSTTGGKMGHLTSGTFSPLLKRGIGMGYVQTSQAQEGTPVSVDIRGKMAKGKLAPFPLYDPEKYGSKRKTMPA